MRRLVFPFAILLAGACRPGTAGTPAPDGTLEAAWTGADTGAIQGRAHAGWCADGLRLELTATREDQALGLALFPADSLVPGEYAAFDPGLDSAVRPGVAAAVRWYTDAAIVGYQGDSGRLTLRSAPEGYGADFGFRMIDVTREDTIRLSGRFQGVRAGACPADSLPNPEQAD